MSEWKEYKLGEICDVRDGTHDSPKANPSGYPLVTSKNIKDGKIDLFNTYLISEADYKFVNQRSEVEQWDIIYSMIGTIGECAIVKDVPTFAIKNVGLFKTNGNQLLAQWIYYYLHSSVAQKELTGRIKGSTQQYISLTDLREFPIMIPPIEEQKQIAGVLSSLDDKIDLLNRENATLEALAETLFRHYFIENPDPTWKEGKLGDEFDFTMGQSPSGDSFNEDGIGIPMYQGNADFGFRFPTRRVYTTAPTRFAEENDTLISVRAPVGAQNMASERCCIGRGVAAFRHKDKSLYSYTYYKLKSLLEDIRQFNDNGTVFGSISKSDFENIDIVIPNRDSIVAFQEQATPIDEKIRTNYKQILVLSAQRDSLLPRLMSGEVKHVE